MKKWHRNEKDKNGYRNGKNKNGNKKIKRLNFILTHNDSHHVYPSSRQLKGTGRFQIDINMFEHDVWHNIFYNLFPEEAIEEIQQATNSDGEVNIGLITAHLEWWRILFGKETLSFEVINIIKENWTYPGVVAVRYSGGWMIKKI